MDRHRVRRMVKARGQSSPGERETLERGLVAPPRSCSDWRSVSFRREMSEASGTPCLTHSLVAKRKTLFDDRPVEISELTYVIKQDLASLNQQIAGLQALTQAQHPKSSRSKTDQEGEHNDNVSDMQDEVKELC